MSPAQRGRSRVRGEGNTRRGRSEKEGSRVGARRGSHRKELSASELVGSQQPAHGQFHSEDVLQEAYKKGWQDAHDQMGHRAQSQSESNNAHQEAFRRDWQAARDRRAQEHGRAQQTKVSTAILEQPSRLGEEKEVTYDWENAPVRKYKYYHLGALGRFGLDEKSGCIVPGYTAEEVRRMGAGERVKAPTRALSPTASPEPGPSVQQYTPCLNFAADRMIDITYSQNTAAEKQASAPMDMSDSSSPALPEPEPGKGATRVKEVEAYNYAGYENQGLQHTNPYAGSANHSWQQSNPYADTRSLMSEPPLPRHPLEDYLIPSGAYKGHKLSSIHFDKKWLRQISRNAEVLTLWPGFRNAMQHHFPNYLKDADKPLPASAQPLARQENLPYHPLPARPSTIPPPPPPSGTTPPPPPPPPPTGTTPPPPPVPQQSPDTANNYVFDWGMHKGKRFDEVPEAYLKKFELQAKQGLMMNRVGLTEAYEWHRWGGKHATNQDPGSRH